MTAIVHVEPTSTYDLIPHASTLAEQIARTDFAPAGLRGKPEAVMAAMLQGHEIGIGPMMALAEISVINGKPCMSAKLMRALVQRAGHELWFHAKSNTKVTIRARRSEWPEDRVAEVTWSMDDAKAAGLAGGQNYRKYPRAMLAARATGEICRDNFADVLGGIGYTPEELTDGDLVADGDLVIGSRVDIEPDKPAGNTRKASRVVAKKGTARKTAAPKAKAEPAPAADLPPLPGEDGYDDDIVDAEIVEDRADDETRDAIQARINDLGVDERRDLTDWWKSQGLPGLRHDDFTADHAELVNDALDAYRPGPDPEARNKKMWAMVAEAWPKDSDDDRDELRRRLIGIVTAGRSDSSKHLTDHEWTALFENLEVIAQGGQELHLRANGSWELRRTTGGA